MPKKSLIQTTEVDVAKKAHNCQANRRHRLERGERRLKVRTDRSFHHYCRACGLIIIQQDIAKLQTLAQQLNDDRERLVTGNADSAAGSR